MYSVAMKFKVTDDLHGVDAVVCAPLSDPLLMPGNLVGACVRCSARVQHRPHVPPNIPLVCMSCYLVDVTDGDTVVVTPRTVREVQNHQRRN